MPMVKSFVVTVIGDGVGTVILGPWDLGESGTIYYGSILPIFTLALTAVYSPQGRYVR